VRLVEHRSRPELDPPAEWAEALGHLEGCTACRERAFALDSSLLFAAQTPLPVGDDEVAAIKANVHTLVRARAAESHSRRWRRTLGRFAAAAAAVALLVLMPTHTSRQPGSAPESAQLVPAPLAPAGGLAADAPAPVIEPLDLPAARIYMLGERDLPIVWVVHESIDV
jgi:hypothetical protein